MKQDYLKGVNKVGLNERMMPCVVGSKLIRASKNFNMYNHFKKGVKKMLRYKNLKNDLKLFSAFEEASNSNEMHGMTPSHGNKLYDEITRITNNMLRHFLDDGKVSPMVLGSIGQAVFDMTCYELLGDEYIEEMNSLERVGGEEDMLSHNELSYILFGIFKKLKDEIYVLNEKISYNAFANIVIPIVFDMFDKHGSLKDEYTSYDVLDRITSKNIDRINSSCIALQKSFAAQQKLELRGFR